MSSSSSPARLHRFRATSVWANSLELDPDQRLVATRDVIALAIILECFGNNASYATRVGVLCNVTASALVAVLALSYVWAARLAYVAALVIVFTRIAPFPSAVANHHYLSLLVLLLLFRVESLGSHAETVTAIKVITGSILFFSGLHKVVSGLYWDGQLLSYLSSYDDRFARLAAVAFKSDISLNAKVSVLGPWEIRSLPGLLVSRAIPVAEICVGVLSIFNRCGRIFIAAVSFLLVAIEAIALEVTFGIIFAALLINHGLPERWVPKMLVATGVIAVMVKGMFPTLGLN